MHQSWLVGPVNQVRSAGAGKEVVNGDRRESPTANCQGDLLAGTVVFAPLVARFPRPGVHLDLTVDQVDDPVNGDSVLAIGDEFLASILAQCPARDLDQQCHVGGCGDAVLVISVAATDDGKVRLRLVVVGNAHRLFLGQVHPAGSRTSTALRACFVA